MTVGELRVIIEDMPDLTTIEIMDDSYRLLSLWKVVPSESSLFLIPGGECEG